MKITVFTPAYNRGYIIHQLYESLCRQTYRNFEWLVVDDGSTDDTGTLIAKFIAEKKIPIRYLRQENGGKHRAVNRGVREAAGTLFFIVDSDDYLADNALERIAFHYAEIAADPSFCGVSGVRARASTGEKVGGEENWKVLDCTYLEFRYKYKIRGDMSEVFKTDVLREFPFPEIPGERFCTEAVVWNRIAQKYKLRYFYERIYICEYRADGLSAGGITLRAQNPRGVTLRAEEEMQMSGIPWRNKIRMAITYWHWVFFEKQRTLRNRIFSVPVWSLLLLPIGGIAFARDFFRIKKKNK